ncbi:MAG: DNA topoisomerase IV subunit A, partial [Burkholderiales bacterium]
KGWVRARQGHGHDWSQFAFKAGDAFHGAYEVRTTDTLYAVATNGRVYSIAVSALPSARGDGAPITTFVDLEAGSRIEHAFAADAETRVLLATRGGNGLVCRAGDLLARNRGGKQFLTLDPRDGPLRPALVPGDGDTVVCLSGNGRLLAFPLAQVKPLRSGGRGVILMGLDGGESLASVAVSGGAGVQVAGTGRGGKPVARLLRPRELAQWAGARARKGKLMEPRVRQASLSLPRPEPAAG